MKNLCKQKFAFQQKLYLKQLKYRVQHFFFLFEEKEKAIVFGESSNDSHCERLRKENDKSDSAPANAGFITCILYLYKL